MQPYQAPRGRPQAFFSAVAGMKDRGPGLSGASVYRYGRQHLEVMNPEVDGSSNSRPNDP
ncbi:hypothetical protein [Streptomyces syringium]|uniref:hypothetical protein n=1 Tax=Streptomyces syringium TaxID=76729 RepID=UPI003443AC86